MRLRRVVLSGFKTFARRTEVELGAGITAVVGPNGSGKSNLVDAIRWGLGETNARELRGARMDEVIHAGGPGRPSAGMAQVDLVLDNEEGRLPCDAAEVEISRRVTRGGDSEYRLNGARARLRDLERMLSATGLTQAGYAMVAQNDVDGIIEATPAQRRALVEEAAGVRGLRSARDAAIERVVGVEQSLLRLQDLLADAEPRLAELAVEAAAALELRGLSARLSELRGSLARERWRAARGQLRQARHRRDAACSRAAAAGEAEVGFTNRLQAEKGRLAQARERRETAGRTLEAARLAAEHHRGESRRFEDRMVAHGLQRAAAALDEAAAVVEAERQHATAAELGGAGVEAAELIGRLAERTRELAEAHAGAERELRNARARAAEAVAAAAAAQRDLAQSAAVHREERARLGLLEEATRGLEGVLASSERRGGELQQLADEAEAGGERAAAEVAEAAARAAGCEAALASARAALAAFEAQLSTDTTRLREAEARAAALSGQLAGTLGGAAVAAAVAAGELAGSRLVDCFAVRDPGDAAAVEAALEAYLGAFLVGDLAAAARHLAGEAGREEVLEAGLPLPPAGSGAELPPGVRAALSAVDPQPQAEGALAHCLRDAWLAADETAAGLAVGRLGGRAVLPDGTVVTAAGRRGGGRPGSTLALAAAAHAAELEVARLGDLEAAQAREVAAARDELGARLPAAEAAAAAASEARSALESARGATAAATAALGAEQLRLRELTDEVEQRRAAIAASRTALAAAAAAQETAAATAGRAATAAGEVEEHERVCTGLLSRAEAALREHELAAARAEPEARDVQRRLTATRTAAEQAEHRRRVAELQRCAAEEAALAALARAGRQRRLAAAAGDEVAAAEAAVAAASPPLERLEATVAALEAERSEVAVAAARAADELGAAEAETLALDAQVAELAEALRADQLDEGPEPDAAAAERAEREIVRLERRVSTMGPVNALAPEQHAALEARARRLRSDHDDLSGACTDLRALADHLAREIEERFSAVFGAVAYHFRLLFEELFPGGRATLRLEEWAAGPHAPGYEGLDAVTSQGHRPPSPAGVEILAQPLGKRLVGLSLLSGGERALTALAVILALQQVNPSPFYVLDEVDAPLDDANIGRFTRVLRRLAERQQFVVVTHNHATMAAADSLYGVTMGDDGISRLLSVRFTTGRAVPHLRDAAAAS